MGPPRPVLDRRILEPIQKVSSVQTMNLGSSVVERWTRDRKVVGSITRRSGGGNVLIQGQLLTLIGVSFTPPWYSSSM